MKQSIQKERPLGHACMVLQFYIKLDIMYNIHLCSDLKLKQLLLFARSPQTSNKTQKVKHHLQLVK